MVLLFVAYTKALLEGGSENNSIITKTNTVYCDGLEHFLKLFYPIKMQYYRVGREKFHEIRILREANFHHLHNAFHEDGVVVGQHNVAARNFLHLQFHAEFSAEKLDPLVNGDGLLVHIIQEHLLFGFGERERLDLGEGMCKVIRKT